MSTIAVGTLWDGRLQLWAITANGGMMSRYQTRAPTNVSSWSGWYDFLAVRGSGPGPLPGQAVDIAVAQLADRTLQLWATTTNGGLFRTGQTGNLQDAEFGSDWTPWHDFRNEPARYPPEPKNVPEPWEFQGGTAPGDQQARDEQNDPSDNFGPGEHRN